MCSPGQAKLALKGTNEADVLLSDSLAAERGLPIPSKAGGLSGLQTRPSTSGESRASQPVYDTARCLLGGNKSRSFSGHCSGSPVAYPHFQEL